MVRRMVRRALLAAPLVIPALALLRGAVGAPSAAIGLALLVVNLWIGGRIIGGLAENRPELLMAGAMIGLFIGLGLVILSGTYLKGVSGVDFAITGLVFAVGHLVLVTWEASDQLLKLPKSSDKQAAGTVARTGS